MLADDERAAFDLIVLADPLAQSLERKQVA
jgi:hypothetical protein